MYMKKMSAMLVFLCIACMNLHSANSTVSGIPEVIRKNTYYVSVTLPNGKMREGAGFMVYRDQTPYIVTALHVIRGYQAISVRLGNGEGRCRVNPYFVNYDKDMVFLRYPCTNPNPDSRLSISKHPVDLDAKKIVGYGFPLSGETVTSHSAQLTYNPLRKLNDLVGNTSLARRYASRRSPSLETKVLEIQATFGQGFSGCPIILDNGDGTGDVIGMLSGGLPSYGYDYCWAIFLNSESLYEGVEIFSLNDKIYKNITEASLMGDFAFADTPMEFGFEATLKTKGNLEAPDSIIVALISNEGDSIFRHYDIDDEGKFEVNVLVEDQLTFGDSATLNFLPAGSVWGESAALKMSDIIDGEKVRFVFKEEQGLPTLSK